MVPCKWQHRITSSPALHLVMLFLLIVSSDHKPIPFENSRLVHNSTPILSSSRPIRIPNQRLKIRPRTLTPTSKSSLSAVANPLWLEPEPSQDSSIGLPGMIYQYNYSRQHIVSSLMELIRRNNCPRDTSIIKNSSLLRNTIIITLRTHTPLLNNDLLPMGSSLIRKLRDIC